jgi:hypothetical protein
LTEGLGNLIDLFTHNFSRRILVRVKAIGQDPTVPQIPVVVVLQDTEVNSLATENHPKIEGP